MCLVVWSHCYSYILLLNDSGIKSNILSSPVCVSRVKQLFSRMMRILDRATARSCAGILLSASIKVLA